MSSLFWAILSELLCMAAVAAAYVPRLTFHGAAAPALSWDASLGEDPLVVLDPEYTRAS